MENGIAIDVVSIIKIYCDVDVARVPDLRLGGRKLLGAYVAGLAVVMVEAKDPDSRQRFTLAHELGHLQLDFRTPEGGARRNSTAFRCESEDIAESDLISDDAEPDDLSERRTKKRPLSEVLANKFASYVLMPERLVRDLWDTSNNIDFGSRQLMVSREAFRIRLRALGLTSG